MRLQVLIGEPHLSRLRGCVILPTKGIATNPRFPLQIGGVLRVGASKSEQLCSRAYRYGSVHFTCNLTGHFRDAYSMQNGPGEKTSVPPHRSYSLDKHASFMPLYLAVLYHICGVVKWLVGNKTWSQTGVSRESHILFSTESSIVDVGTGSNLLHYKKYQIDSASNSTGKVAAEPCENTQGKLYLHFYCTQPLPILA